MIIMTYYILTNGGFLLKSLPAIMLYFMNVTALISASIQPWNSKSHKTGDTL